MSRRRKSESPLNLGPASTLWLASIGVRTLTDVQRVGSVGIYRMLKEAGYPVSMNMVYALEGAMMGMRWDKLPAGLKKELREAVGMLGKKSK